MLILFLLCVVGFLLLYFGAEWLVRGSSSLAKSLGITPIVIGLTVVAFGTSAPELVVSMVSSIRDESMMAVGNVVGSNICNIALVLGMSALFQPITCHNSVVKRDIPIMLGISLILLFFSLNSTISRLEGVVLFAGIILYTVLNYTLTKKQVQNNPTGSELVIDFSIEEVADITSRGKQIILILFGIIGVVAGAQIVVHSAEKIMTILKVSEKFVGLTIVALGTSLPELATSVMAAIKKEMDISIGNLVGSNVFNILSVIGATAMVKPIPIPGGFIDSGLITDYGVMMLTSFLPWLMMRKTATINRSHGVILLSIYVIYIIYLILKS